MPRQFEIVWESLSFGVVWGFFSGNVRSFALKTFSVWEILLILGHLVHRYEDGTESPVPVQLKSLGDGSVITRITPHACLPEPLHIEGYELMAEPTWDSSSDTSYSPEPQDRDSTNSTRSASPSPIREGDVKLVEGGQTFILTHGNEPKRSIKRRQSSHRKEFHNVLSPLPVLILIYVQSSSFSLLLFSLILINILIQVNF